jgi:hypothetical protein
MVTQFFRETSRPPWRRAGREAIIYCVNNPHGRQSSDQRGEHRTIHPIQTGLWISSAQHGDFMPQHQKFDVLRRRRATQQHSQIQ